MSAPMFIEKNKKHLQIVTVGKCKNTEIQKKAERMISLQVKVRRKSLEVIVLVASLLLQLPH